MKWRKWFGLCEHQWRHATNTVIRYGVYEVLYCDKCHKFTYRKWRS